MTDTIPFLVFSIDAGNGVLGFYMINAGADEDWIIDR
jgi:hypothetical protein